MHGTAPKRRARVTHVIDHGRVLDGPIATLRLRRHPVTILTTRGIKVHMGATAILVLRFRAATTPRLLPLLNRGLQRDPTMVQAFHQKDTEENMPRRLREQIFSRSR